MLGWEIRVDVEANVGYAAGSAARFDVNFKHLQPSQAGKVPKTSFRQINCPRSMAQSAGTHKNALQVPGVTPNFRILEIS